MPWLILQKLVGTEYAAERKLTQRAGLQIYIPRRRKVIKPRHTHGTRTVILPLFPRYLFANTPRETIAEVRPRIREAAPRALPIRVRDEYEYLFCNDKDIAELRAREAAGEFDQMVLGMAKRIELRIGSMVLVSDDSLFAGRRGTVKAHQRHERTLVAFNGYDVSIETKHLILDTEPSAGPEDDETANPSGPRPVRSPEPADRALS
jgi:hypothetical protein